MEGAVVPLGDVTALCAVLELATSVQSCFRRKFVGLCQGATLSARELGWSGKTTKTHEIFATNCREHDGKLNLGKK